MEFRRVLFQSSRFILEHKAAIAQAGSEIAAFMRTAADASGLTLFVKTIEVMGSALEKLRGPLQFFVDHMPVLRQADQMFTGAVDRAMLADAAAKLRHESGGDIVVTGGGGKGGFDPEAVKAAAEDHKKAAEE